MYVHLRTTRRWVGMALPPLERYTFEVVECRRVPGKGPRSRFVLALGSLTIADLIDALAGETTALHAFEQRVAVRLHVARLRGTIPDDATFKQLCAAADVRLAKLVDATLDRLTPRAESQATSRWNQRTQGA